MSTDTIVLDLKIEDVTGQVETWISCMPPKIQLNCILIWGCAGFRLDQKTGAFMEFGLRLGFGLSCQLGLAERILNSLPKDQKKN